MPPGAAQTSVTSEAAPAPVAPDSAGQPPQPAQRSVGEAAVVPALQQTASAPARVRVMVKADSPIAARDAPTPPALPADALPVPDPAATDLAASDLAAPPAPEPPPEPAVLFESPPAPVADARPAEATSRIEPPRPGAEPTPAMPIDPAPRTPPIAAPIAARAASPAAFAWPARQVAPCAVALALGADSSLTLTLDPAELGRVEVAIERAQGEATIRVTAERADTLMLLQRDARELERALADIGMGERGPSLSFSLGDGGASQDTSGRQGERAATQSPRLGLAGPAGASAIPHAARQGAAHRGLIDLAF
jgi:Meckel syndrome type 1 protein